ncbi:MAG: flagellar biosynthetic protein FliR [Armatimonadota bacterium]|nr:flagellar biosynthetic protein FliR [Armatimonadota bacterium]
MDLASFSIERLEAFILILSRTAGIFAITPLFGSNQVPLQIRIAMAVGLAIVFVPLYRLNGVLASDALQMALLIGKETLVGLVIGFVATLVLTTVQIAGEFVDMQSGFSFASMVDPVNGTHTAVVARLHYLIAGLLFFVTNAHHVMIQGLADSFSLVPIGQLVINSAVANGVMDLFVHLFMVAIRIAMPVLSAVFLADISLALIARAVPQMNVLIVGFPLKIGVGLVGILVALPVIMASAQGLFGDIYSQTGSILRLFVGQ